MYFYEKTVCDCDFKILSYDYIEIVDPNSRLGYGGVAPRKK